MCHLLLHSILLCQWVTLLARQELQAGSKWCILTTSLNYIRSWPCSCWIPWQNSHWHWFCRLGIAFSSIWRISLILTVFYTDLEIENIHLISQKREDSQWLNLRYFLKVVARITEDRTELTFLVSADNQRQAKANWPRV